MAKLQIKYYGASVLRREAKVIGRVDEEVRKLAVDMVETMYQYRGVGLAAPQVGVSKRLIVVDCGEEYQDAPLVLLNPEVVETEGTQTGDEGCLSMPELFLPVTRPMKATVRATELSGKTVEITGEDLLARCLLHEIDHLNGVLFTDRVEDKDAVAKGLSELKTRVELILTGRHPVPTSE